MRAIEYTRSPYIAILMMMNVKQCISKSYEHNLMAEFFLIKSFSHNNCKHNAVAEYH